MPSSLHVSEDPLFDPNAFGIATLLGGLFILGLASDMMNNSSTDPLAWSLGYFGIILLACSLVSFIYSFIYCFRITSSDEIRPLILDHQHKNYSCVTESSQVLYSQQQQHEKGRFVIKNIEPI